MKFDPKYILEFIKNIFVQCPNCNEKGIVTSQLEGNMFAKFICSNCGANKEWNGNFSVYMTKMKNFENFEGILFGPPVDCFFKFPLWYQTNLKEHVLYANNLEHLNFINSYVQEKLRERTQTESGWSNSSLQSRLPKWILAAKNRELIIRKILELGKK